MLLSISLRRQSLVMLAPDVSSSSRVQIVAFKAQPDLGLTAAPQHT